MVGSAERVRAREEWRRSVWRDEPGDFATVGDAGKRMKLMAAIAGAGLLTIAIAALPSAPSRGSLPQMPSPRDVVSPAAYASADPAAQGSSMQLAVVLKIRDGFHINARQPSAEYLIP